MTDRYSNFSELMAGEDPKNFSIRSLRRKDAAVVILAPHAGRIEVRTGEIAELVADKEFSLYCFYGLKNKNCKADLHITSHNFDEPRCLKLIAHHQHVVAIHGSRKPGECLFIGGLDTELIGALVSALQAAGITAIEGVQEYAGLHPLNICNRGASNSGVQFELSMAFRRGAQMPKFVAAVRSVLLRFRKTR
jgi:phage replication-related protein YjqB (UPF0714/DUF867 family)